MSLNVGEILNNRYRVGILLGQGGASAVYKAWDMNLNTPVVVKEHIFSSPEIDQQFTQQARALANLRHANLPYVIDHFSIAGRGQYLVMEYIDGKDLHTWVSQAGQGLPEAQVLPWIQQVCDALTYLHTQKPPILHRDVKPVNIRVTSAGKAVLVDYGVGLAYDPSDAATMIAGATASQIKSAIGNAYTAPEAYLDQADQRSEIYALGATLYLALTGRPPLDSVKRQQGQALTPPRKIGPAISPTIEALVLQAMNLAPDLRFKSAAAFKNALGVSVVVGVQKPATYAPAPPAVQPTMKVQEPPLPPPPRKVQPEREVIPLEASRANREVSKLPWIIAGAAVVLFCLVGGVLGGMSLSEIFPSANTPTPVSIGVSVDATRTALASLEIKPTLTQPPPTAVPPTPVTLPSDTPTQVPSLPATFPPSQTPIPTFTPTPPVRPTWSPCAGTYPSRLNVGDKAYVSFDPPLANNVRTLPNVASTIVGSLQPGEQMEVIGGPICSDQWIWWQVSSLSSGISGWTAEGDLKDYWLVPLQ